MTPRTSAATSKPESPDAPPALPAGVARIGTVAGLLALLSRHNGAEEVEIHTDGTLRIHGADVLDEDPGVNCLTCQGA